MSEFIADGKYLALRGYLEEHSSLLRQILDELKAQGKMENARIRNAVEKSLIDSFERTDEPKAQKTSDGTSKATQRTAQETGPKTVETVKEEPLKTTETVEVKEDAKGKSKPRVKPAVNWNS